MKKMNFQKHTFIVLGSLLTANMFLLLCCLYLIVFSGQTAVPEDSEAVLPEESELSQIMLTKPSISLEEFMEDYSKLYEYNTEKAMADGCIITCNFSLTNGADKWLNFLEASQNGQDCFVRMVQYSSEYHINRIMDINYGQGRYHIKSMMEGSLREGEYLYMKSDQSGINESASILYYFTNRPNADLQELSETPESQKLQGTPLKFIKIADGELITLEDRIVSQYGGISDYDVITLKSSRAIRIKSEISLSSLTAFSSGIVYTAEEAAADGCVVIEDGLIVGGASLWIDFLVRSGKQKDAAVRIVCYENEKTIYGSRIMELIYKNNKYLVSYLNENGDVQEEVYQYLKCYPGSQEGENSSYVLTNNPDLTREAWMQNFQGDMPGGVRMVFSYHPDTNREALLE